MRTVLRPGCDRARRRRRSTENRNHRQPGGRPVQFDAVVEIQPSVSSAAATTVCGSDPEPCRQRRRDRRADRQPAPQLRRTVSGRAGCRLTNHVTIDIEAPTATNVPSLTTTDYDYLLGSGAVVRNRREPPGRLRERRDRVLGRPPRIPKKKSRCSSRSPSRRSRKPSFPTSTTSSPRPTLSSRRSETFADMADRMNTMRIQQANMAVQQKRHRRGARCTRHRRDPESC